MMAEKKELRPGVVVDEMVMLALSLLSLALALFSIYLLMVKR